MAAVQGHARLALRGGKYCEYTILFRTSLTSFLFGGLEWLAGADLAMCLEYGQRAWSEVSGRLKRPFSNG
jgi:hypothetical protein